MKTVLAILTVATLTGCTARPAGSELASAPQEAVSQEQIQVLNTMSATRRHRLDHYLWHMLRGVRFDQRADLRDAVAEALGADWVPPRPANSPAYNANGQAGGEDFLYMHREMIVAANELLK